MSVTPAVAHVEMWPYVASAAAWSSNQAATAALMLASVTSPLAVGRGVGRGVGLSVGRGDGCGEGPGVVGVDVGRGVGH